MACALLALFAPHLAQISITHLLACARCWVCVYARRRERQAVLAKTVSHLCPQVDYDVPENKREEFMQKGMNEKWEMIARYEQHKAMQEEMMGTAKELIEEIKVAHLKKDEERQRILESAKVSLSTQPLKCVVNVCAGLFTFSFVCACNSRNASVLQTSPSHSR